MSFFTDTKRMVIGIYIMAIALYWLLRIIYFTNNSEQIFSDIAIYVQIADQIYHHFEFGEGKYYAFFSPGAPAAIAFSKLVAGASFQTFYSYFVAAINFTGVFILSREFGRLMEKPWLGAIFMLVIAVLKPSIFWELKLSTEGIAEALLHMSLALTLLAWRLQKAGLAFSAGVVFAWLFLTRPQYLLGLPFLAIFFLVGRQSVLSARVTFRDRYKNIRLAMVASFIVGISVLWMPWLVRNYLHYGAVVPVSMAGAQTLIWDYGLAPIKAGAYTSITKGDGTVVPLDLQAALSYGQMAKTDREFYMHLRELYDKWITLNWRYLWVPYLTRTTNVLGAIDHGGLSTLSREILFPWHLTRFNVPNRDHSPLNLILLDKNSLLMIVGILGLLILQFQGGVAFLPITALVTLMWAVPGFTLGFPRVVDAQIGTTILGAVWLLSDLFARFDKGATSCTNRHP